MDFTSGALGRALTEFDILSGIDAPDQRACQTAQCILRLFDAYQQECRSITWLAKGAFEDRRARESLALSKRRLLVYSETIHEVADRLHINFPELATDESLWPMVDEEYARLATGRYAFDLANAYINSVRRMLYKDEWKPVEYSFGKAGRASGEQKAVVRRFPGGAQVTPQLIQAMLDIPQFGRHFQDAETDCRMAAETANGELGLDGSDPEAISGVEVASAGFYRNRGAYLVGRLELKDGGWAPLALSLENHVNGIFIDAVLTREADLHNLFSSTLANFHTTIPHYHELAGFLHSIMPRRALGLHYSTIGFNHIGKVAVIDEITQCLGQPDAVMDTAPGFRGTVAIGFTAPALDYVLKVIRDTPTEGYKWGEFGGVPSVLAKYGRVHEINRTGSMLDNIIYYNIRLPRAWFAEALADDLLGNAGGTVSTLAIDDGDFLVFRHLIVQAKMVPLPLFLETADRDAAETAIINLGHCIRNNAAANIFNKDLDGRNYGVGDFSKVYLFDYDALEDLTDVKIHTNVGREHGEEEPPDWFFEDGIVFLPEEIDVGLRIPDRNLRRLFRDVHGELLSYDYWKGIQDAIARGLVPRLRVYPEDTRLRERRTDASRA